MNKRSLFFLAGWLLPLMLAAQSPKIIYLNENRDIIYDVDIVDSVHLIALAPAYLALWDFDNKSIVKKYDGINLICLDAASSGKLVALGNKQGDIQLLSLADGGTVLQKQYPAGGAVTDVKFSAKDSLVAATFYSGFFVVVNVASGDVWEYNLPENRAMSAGFSRSGRYLAVGDHKGQVMVYDLTTRQLVTNYTLKHATVKELIWTQDDTRLIIAGHKKGIITISNPASPGSKSAMKTINVPGTLSSAAYVDQTKSTIACTLEGTARIYFDLGKYKYKKAVAMHSVCALPLQGVYMRLAIATNGMGVMLLNSKNMKLNEE